MGAAWSHERTAGRRPSCLSSSHRKREAFERLIRGAGIERVSRDLGVTAAQLSQWRDTAIRAAEMTFMNHAQPDVSAMNISRDRRPGPERVWQK